MNEDMIYAILAIISVLEGILLHDTFSFAGFGIAIFAMYKVRQVSKERQKAQNIKKHK